jgi:N-acetylmuramoyl-L-alanine amidase
MSRPVILLCLLLIFSTLKPAQSNSPCNGNFQLKTQNQISPVICIRNIDYMDLCNMEREKEPQSNPANSAGIFEIFGKKYQNVTRKSNQLQGVVYYIVAGHGGPDPGAQGNKDGHIMSEDEYAYDISLRVARELISHGALVYMITRDNDDGIRDDEFLANDKDETVWKNQKIPFGVNSKLRQRTRAINSLYNKNKGKYQRMIEIHIDSRQISERVDVFGYYNSKRKLSKEFANNIINTIAEKYKKHQPNRGFSGISQSRDGLFMLKFSHPTACFLELGNIKNPADQIRFTKAENRQVIADWITDGCIKDYRK